MPISFTYRDPVDGDTDITDHVVLRSGENPVNMATNAEERSVGAWTLDVEDEGDFDFHAQRSFYVLEDLADDPVIWVGQTEDQGSNRGASQRTGAERTIGLNLIDLNTLLERRVVREGVGGNRPAETDVERMEWLAGLGYIGSSTDYIGITGTPVDMDANDFTGRMASEVIEDCMGQSGANCFMFRDPTDGVFKTFYGDSGSEVDVLSSDLRISNIDADIDADAGFGDPGAGADWVWAASLDSHWDELSTRVYSGLFANYDGGAVYNERFATVAQFSHRDTVLSWPDVKSEAKATSRALRYLATIDTEEYRVQTTIEVSPEHVNDAWPGQRIQCRFSHFPPFVAWTWMRILNRAVTWLTPERYRIRYELAVTTAAPPLSCAQIVTALDLYNSATIPGGPPCAFTPVLPADSPAVALAYMVMFNDGTAIGPPIVGPDLTMSGYTEVEHYEGAPAAYEHSLFMLGSTTGTPGEMSCTFVGNGAEGYMGFAVSIPGSGDVVQSTKQETSGSILSLPSTPTPGNMLIMFRTVETLGFTADPGAEWTQIGETIEASPGHISARQTSVFVHCVEAGDGKDWGNGDASFSHWSFLVEVGS